MRPQTHNPAKGRRAARHPWRLLLAGGFLLLAAVLGVALVGYQTLALLFAALALWTLLLHFASPTPRRVLRAAAAAGLCCLLLLEIPVVRESRGDTPNDAAYLIVLGAGVNGEEPSRALTDRLTAAQAYLAAHPQSKAILSGGQGPGEAVSEARAMYRWLTARGVDAGRLYLEERSATTQENLACAAALLRTLDAGAARGPVALLSSEYHLYQAKYFARAQGLTPLGVPARTSLPVLRLNYFLREAAAVGRLWLFGY